MKSSIEVETPYDGKLFKVQTLSWTDERGRYIQREVVRHPGAVLVVPILDRDTVIMIRNYRVAVDEQLWEFHAGKLEPEEQPIDAAPRELEEETGYRAAHIHKLGEFYTSPGFTNELMHVFVAEGLTFIGQRLEAGEEIEVATIPVHQAITMIHDGQIRDGKTVAGLLMWQNRLLAIKSDQTRIIQPDVQHIAISVSEGRSA